MSVVTFTSILLVAGADRPTYSPTTHTHSWIAKEILDALD